jgi:FtsH-binding integral membrane protein
VNLRAAWLDQHYWMFGKLGSETVRYFAYMADQSFKTAPGGERLFYFGGPWSRPYIVPDNETEQKLYRKVLWSLRIMLGGLIVAIPFLPMAKLLDDSLYFFAYLLAVSVVFWLGRKLVLMRDLQHLQRAAAKLPLRSFFAQMAEKHSALALSSGLGVSVLFVAVGFAGLFLGDAAAPAAIFCIGFFALCTAAWGYALSLKVGHAGR